MVIPRVQWRQPDQFKALNDLGPTIKENEFLLGNEEHLAQVLATVGIPTVEGAKTPKEEAIGLLMLAAEVEHALMVQYLYASASVVGSLRKTITDIAVEEMAHLLTVQNLLLALTGREGSSTPFQIHLGRDLLRRQSSFNPLPFTLEKVSKTTLAKFTVVEKPEKILDQTIREKVEQMENDLIADKIDPNPVFALYAAIRWIFQPSDAPIGRVSLSVEMGFKPGHHLKAEDFADTQTIDRYVSNENEWTASADLIIKKVRNHNEAIEALDDITEQGEGPASADDSDSHFSRFYTAYIDFLENGASDVKDLPRTPFVNGQMAPEDPNATRISATYAASWARLFNVQYELMLVDIAYAISRPVADVRRQAMISDVCREQMSKVIGVLTKKISELPLSENSDSFAGPPYGLDNELMPQSDSEFLQRYEQLESTSLSAIFEIKQSPTFPDDFLATIPLQSIEGVTQKRAEIIQPQENII
ncbi:ferritin-like domain-containing protein [Roseibacillus persicicus]|uniref:Iminophenyl-pyruvate dimer synthase domain-containing protein n=1 Tax=Roseibacillus persicicus TaxID=454148 RepID=A0A918TNJ0_9BACT|nr:ferritin-like domain-containing protein [Roseibacillus persicicus]GHC55998.1 hypothetical protein GCM10007100_23600 [Roseibacillus persicicus]